MLGHLLEEVDELGSSLVDIIALESGVVLDWRVAPRILPVEAGDRVVVHVLHVGEDFGRDSRSLVRVGDHFEGVVLHPLVFVLVVDSGKEPAVHSWG